MLQHERDQKVRIEKMVEQLARQHSHLEEAAQHAIPSAVPAGGHRSSRNFIYILFSFNTTGSIAISPPMQTFEALVYGNIEQKMISNVFFFVYSCVMLLFFLFRTRSALSIVLVDVSLVTTIPEFKIMKMTEIAMLL